MDNVASMAWGLIVRRRHRGRRHARGIARDPVLEPLDRHLLGQRLKGDVRVDGLVGDGGPDDRTLRDEAISQSRE